MCSVSNIAVGTYYKKLHIHPDNYLLKKERNAFAYVTWRKVGYTMTREVMWKKEGK